MIELVNGNEVIKVAEELTIAMYQKLEKNKDLYLADTIQIISLFTGLPVKKLKTLQPKTIKLLDMYISSKINFTKSNQLIYTFIHNGIEYGLEKDFGKMSWGAWVDLEVYSVGDDITNNINKIMSVLYRPIVKKDGAKYTIEEYDSDTIDERAEIFLELPISYWWEISDFFLRTANSYITNINRSLELKMKLNNLMETGKMIFPKWMRDKLPRGFTLN